MTNSRNYSFLSLAKNLGSDNFFLSGASQALEGLVFFCLVICTFSLFFWVPLSYVVFICFFIVIPKMRFFLRFFSAHIRRRTSVAVTLRKVLLLGLLAHNDAPRASAAR